MPSRMPLSSVEHALILSLSYVLWRTLRGFFVRNPLDNIPGPPSDSFLAGVLFLLERMGASLTSPTGNVAQLHGPDGFELHQSLERDYDPVVRIHGLFGATQLYVYDPVALHSIVMKDQDLYEESPVFLSLSGLLFGKGILSTTGEEHRRHRKVLVQAFSTRNLRGMVPVLYEVAHRLRDGLMRPQVKDSAKELDMNALLSRTSLEFIGRAGIGHSFDTLASSEEPVDPYTESLKNLTLLIRELAVFTPLAPLISKLGSASLQWFLLGLVPLRSLSALRDVVSTMEARAKTLVCQQIRAMEKDSGKMDVTRLLLKMDDEGTRWTDADVVTRTSMIIQTATDTTSSSLNRVVHLLALYPDIQERLRAELACMPEQMDFDQLVGLPYLDGFIRETLRLYPPIPLMSRIVTQDCILPLSRPIQGLDGKMMGCIPLQKGTGVYIAISAANHNPAVWGADAREFKPERWENGRAEVGVRMSGVYSNTMTFVGGRRSCIGFKFVQLELKVVLSVLLRSFRFSAPSDEIRWSVGAPASPSVRTRPLLPIVVEWLSPRQSS
ncbi:cytochrome P450 [Roridomyces roridus]|uniref:Cytochrome P450 n=1 Tax=Roridomyces roridus TaxID=1738132 RepID=A0AAD7BBD8_9AGAR|nr:cytochrome P450 [Roridomyces roridus]